MLANLGPDPRMGSLISDFKLGSGTHNGDGMEINARISKESRKDTKMNLNPNQMYAQMPLLLAEIVLASAKNVNRLRTLRRHHCRQALGKPPIIYKHCKAAY